MSDPHNMIAEHPWAFWTAKVDAIHTHPMSREKE